MADELPITRVEAQAFQVPTDQPEADGTIAWDSTTLVVAWVGAGEMTGIGYTYADVAAAAIINAKLASLLRGEDALAIPKLGTKMVDAVRNIGLRGVAACAISALDVALWDLKARLLDISLADLFGRVRNEVAVYGSGGFTTYSRQRLCEQLEGWTRRDGCQWVKMKIGAVPSSDLGRVEAARAAIGNGGLYVDANGAYLRKQALRFARQFADLDVSWFEEPVSSDDLEGLRLMRDRAPDGMEIAAGEYGYDGFYFRRMLEAGAVDVLQADATRCGGYSGFLTAAALADACGLPLSAHTAPALHLPVCCSARRVRNMEWFYDHVRIEQMLFDGAPIVRAGTIKPDLGRPGHGLDFKLPDAERYKVGQ